MIYTEVQNSPIYLDDLTPGTTEHYLINTRIKLIPNQWYSLPSMHACGGKIIRIATTPPSKLGVRFNPYKNQYEINSKCDASRWVRVQALVVENASVIDNITPIQPVLLPNIIKQYMDILFVEASNSSRNNLYPKHFQCIASALTSIHQGSLQQKLMFCQSTLTLYFQEYKNAPVDESAEYFSHDTSQLKHASSKMKKQLQTLIDRKGACRHRAFFATLLAQYIGLPAKYIGNDYHAFSELYNGNAWINWDLGGVEVRLNIKSVPPNLKSLMLDEKTTDIQRKKRKHSEDVASLNLFKTKFPWLANCKNTQDVIAGLCTHEHRTLIYIKGASQARALYQLLHHAASQQNQLIFYIGSSDDFQEYSQLLKIENGKCIETQGPVKKIKAQGGLFVINLDGFKPTEILDYKSIWVSAQTKVVMLTPVHRKTESELLTLAKIFKWPQNIKHPEVDPFTIHSQPSQVADYIIDLYHGEGEYDWQSRLLEHITPCEGAQYHSKQGDFPTILEKGTHANIALRDIPDDKNFQSFLLRTLVDRKLWVNGETLNLPETFKIQCLVAPQTALQPLETQTIDLESKDEIFCLNPQSFPQLFEQYVIENNRTLIKAGWLKENPALPKTLVITAPLSQGSERCLRDVLVKAPHVSIARLPSQLPQQTSHMLSSAKIIETNDLIFTVDKLVATTPDVLVIPINQETSWGDIIENITESGTVENNDLHYERIPMPAFVAWKEGKTVILQGKLSAELYYSIEPLFIQPLLRINGKNVHADGKFIIVTSPQNSYDPQLAKISSNLEKVTITWSDYEQRLKKCPEFNEENFSKIKRFYQIASTVPHSVVGAPQSMRLSYQRLRNMLTALSQPSSHENPIKAFFHHDYDKNSEAYAFLNVVAKLLFSKQTNKLRPNKEKYQQYPHHADFFWRRANCYSGKQLSVFWGLWGKENTPTDFTNIQTSLLEAFQVPPVHRDIEEKAVLIDKSEQRLGALLTTQACVVLKGPPGSGKTYTASHYAQQKNGVCYWWNFDDSDKVIANWLADSHKLVILVVDEANMEQPGMLSKFYGMLSAPPRVNGKIVPSSHKIIFTCNPEHYVGRHYHAFLQDLPTIYFDKWKGEKLKDHILVPLQQKLETQFTDEQLSQLITVYCCIERLLAPGSVSIRDLEQLFLRVTYQSNQALDTATTFSEIAYSACYAEWHSLLQNQTQKDKYEQVLAEQFTIKHPPFRALPATLKEGIKKSIKLCPSIEQSLVLVRQDLQTNEWCQQYHAKLGKLGKGGTLIEGSTGLAKTTSLLALLISMGYKQLSTEQPPSLCIPPESHWFILLTSDNSNAEDWLNFAFEYGGKVISKGVHLKPTISKLLGQLLTGKKEDGTQAKKLGFYVLATQSTVLDNGPFELSRPLKNRLHVIRRNSYTDTELASFISDEFSNISQGGVQRIIRDYREEERTNPESCNARTFFEGLVNIDQSSPDFKRRKLDSEEDRHYSNSSHASQASRSSQKIFREASVSLDQDDKSMRDTTMPDASPFNFVQGGLDAANHVSPDVFANLNDSSRDPMTDDIAAPFLNDDLFEQSWNQTRSTFFTPESNQDPAFSMSDDEDLEFNNALETFSKSA